MSIEVRLVWNEKSWDSILSRNNNWCKRWLIAENKKSWAKAKKLFLKKKELFNQLSSDNIRLKWSKSSWSLSNTSDHQFDAREVIGEIRGDWFVITQFLISFSYPWVTALQVLSTPAGSLARGMGPHRLDTFSVNRVSLEFYLSYPLLPDPWHLMKDCLLEEDKWRWNNSLQFAASENNK